MRVPFCLSCKYDTSDNGWEVQSTLVVYCRVSSWEIIFCYPRMPPLTSKSTKFETNSTINTSKHYSDILTIFWHDRMTIIPNYIEILYNPSLSSPVSKVDAVQIGSTWIWIHQVLICSCRLPEWGISRLKPSDKSRRRMAFHISSIQPSKSFNNEIYPSPKKYSLNTEKPYNYQRTTSLMGLSETISKKQPVCTQLYK